MKTLPTLLVLASTLLLSSARAQVVLQNFSSTVGTTTFFHGTWEASGDPFGTNSPNINFVQGAGVYDFTGTTGLVPTNDANSKVEFFNGTAVSIGTNTFLSVSAQMLATNAATSFAVTLVDTGGKTAFSTFSAVDFVTGSYTTITGALTFQAGFVPASINSMIISGNQSGGSAQFNISFDNIAATSAIPEPGTYAALAGAVALGFAAWRRRRAPRNPARPNVT
ncbi:MAG: PEP-CTERM sorting domain-containing protein [Opitutaceae bacterium]|nr:PEP-CTERM sorting domain-containing protein [Opitutaceae bacterium]